MTTWVDRICHVCGLKAYNREEEYYGMVPASVTTQFHAAPVTTQPELPPVTGPYIPLDQCLSGPLRLPERENEADKSPGTDRESVFTDDETFAPSVNWDTFPREDLPPRPPKPPNLIPPRSYHASDSDCVYDNARPVHRYSNSTRISPATPKQDGNVFRYDFAPGTSPSIESGLGSSGGRSPQSAGLYKPPPANRGLKPGKSAPQSPGAPVINRNLKPARPTPTSDFNLLPAPVNRRGKLGQRAAPSPTPPLPEAPHPPTNEDKAEYYRIHYLDLAFPDGEEATAHKSPRPSVSLSGPQNHTVYKTIDVKRTEALNLVRRDIRRDRRRATERDMNSREN